jgi:phosphate butyryltransferase
MLKNLDSLVKLALGKQPKTLVVVHADDEFVMDAVCQATRLGMIKPILIGDQAKIKELLTLNKITTGYEIIHETNDDIEVRLAMDLINQGKADILMKGLLDTKVLLKGVVNSEFGIKKYKLLSHVGMVEFPHLDRILFATDGAMNIQPSIEEKILLIENAVHLTKALGYEQPKVGLVSAVEKLNPKIISTVEAESIKAYYYDHPQTEFLIDGPFAIDNLVSMASVHHKGLGGLVAGKADILVFPNLDGGNIFYKTSVFLGLAKAAGIIIGAKVPIVLTSRADDSDTKLNSIALAVGYSHGLSNLSH